MNHDPYIQAMIDQVMKDAANSIRANMYTAVDFPFTRPPAHRRVAGFGLDDKCECGKIWPCPHVTMADAVVYCMLCGATQDVVINLGVNPANIRCNGCLTHGKAALKDILRTWVAHEA